MYDYTGVLLLIITGI